MCVSWLSLAAVAWSSPAAGARVGDGDSQGAMEGVLLGASSAEMIGSVRGRGAESWMGDNWKSIKEKTLLDLTLPGSHNSGNIAGKLSADRVCSSDYRYQEYLDSGGSARPSVGQAEFDRTFIPWNINHDHTILQQLEKGTRYFHLKVCNFNKPGSNPLDLSNVLHQHRGYTAQSLRSILSDMGSFLLANPYEFVVLGFNNLHSSDSKAFAHADVSALAASVVAFFAGLGLDFAAGEELGGTALEQLVASRKRLVAFFPGASAAAPGLPEGASASGTWLIEGWSDVMASGDLKGSEAWLQRDLETSAVQRGKFYVMQANPNDSELNMYARLRSGKPPHSLRAWIAPFLLDLKSLIQESVADAPAIRINAISTDYLDTSSPFDIAMSLMGLPSRPRGEVPTSKSSRACLNPAVISGKFEDGAVDSSRYKLRAAHVMQRHCDRWIYKHDLIGNKCWPEQLNSSAGSSRLMAEECLRLPRAGGNLTSAWHTFPRSSDPYAPPASGACQVHGETPQASDQGSVHARMWGEMLRRQYVPALVPEDCSRGSIGLYADAVHKNQITAQTEFLAICGRPPTPAEFPPNSTLVGYAPGIAKGTPWYIQSKQCRDSTLDAMLKEADDAKLSSTWWQGPVQVVAAEAARTTGKAAPASESAAEFLDNLMDCTVVHACTGLADTPPALLDQATGLPGQAHASLYARMDRAETKSRTWGLSYWQQVGGTEYSDFASRYYGYFFAVLADRLRAAARGHPRAPKLTVAVMSDSNISPLLFMYGLGSQAAERPPYLSALVHEVYEDRVGESLWVRVLFNGQVLRVCRSESSFPLCPLGEWLRLIEAFIPSRVVCPALYEEYDFLTGPPPWA